MPKDGRLDLILFGATGFTGWIAAQYICKFGPSKLQWAIAARSQDKLNAKLRELRNAYPDRIPPETIVANLDEVSAIRLATSCKVVVTTVGPYSRYGAGLVKACAEAGTHYVDCTGEHPWVLDMVEKYHDTAKQTGALIIPQCAFESVPADLTSYKIASLIREKYNAPTKDVTFSLQSLNGGASGGTLESILSLFDVYSLSQLHRSSQALALSPIKRPYSSPSRLPVFSHPNLGIQMPWFQGTPDRAIVMRSWGLTKQYTPEKSWGENFSFTEHKKAKSWAEGIVAWLTMSVLSFGMVLSPVRWLARKIVTQPGFGPNQQGFDKSRQGNLDWKAVGVVDDDEGKKKVLGSFTYEEGDAYALTALLIVEAAFTILDLEKRKAAADDECLAKIIGGGVLTSACLGEPYLKRLNSVGIKVEAREL